MHQYTQVVVSQKRWSFTVGVSQKRDYYMINSIISLSVQGVVNLLWLPVQQYQEDKRIVWGLQRGTTSFASSTGIAVVELTNRALYSVHVCSLLRIGK